MEIKQKHGKHALRKAVTAAVLAGTAFSSLGGFAGAVTTVKADENRDPRIVSGEDRERIISLLAEKSLQANRLGKSDEEILKELREVLSKASVPTLKVLLNGMDTARQTYGKDEYYRFLQRFGSFRPDNKLDFYHRTLNLSTLIVEELKNRISNEEKLNKDLVEKKSELEQLKEKEKEILTEKGKIEDKLIEKSYELEKKVEELRKKEDELEENKVELTDTFEELEKVKESVKDKRKNFKLKQKLLKKTLKPLKLKKKNLKLRLLR